MGRYEPKGYNGYGESGVHTRLGRRTNRASVEMKWRLAIRGGTGWQLRLPSLAALCGRRWNPQLRVFYERLRAAAKPPKVVLVACARKLLTILNAMVRSNTRWAVPAPSAQHSC